MAGQRVRFNNKIKYYSIIYLHITSLGILSSSKYIHNIQYVLYINIFYFAHNICYRYIYYYVCILYNMYFVYEQNPHRLVFGAETSKTAAFNRCVKNKYIYILPRNQVNLRDLLTMCGGE